MGEHILVSIDAPLLGLGGHEPPKALKLARGEVAAQGLAHHVRAVHVLLGSYGVKRLLYGLREAYGDCLLHIDIVVQLGKGVK